MKRIIIIDPTVICFLFLLFAGIAHGQTVRLIKGVTDTLIIRTITQNPSGGNTTVDNVYTDSASVKQVALNNAAQQYESVARLRAELFRAERIADQWAGVYRQVDTTGYTKRAALQFGPRIVGNYRYVTGSGQGRQTFSLEIFVAPNGLLRGRQSAQNGQPLRNGTVVVRSPGNITINNIWFSGTTGLLVEFGRGSDDQPYVGDNGPQKLELRKIN